MKTRKQKSCIGQAENKTNESKKQLNTENMKTRISQLVAALFFVIVVAGNVNATEHDVKASSHENIETALEFENWMMDEDVWNTSNIHYAEAVEETLEMKNWMTNEIVWEVQSTAMVLENWMINNSIWEVESATEFKTETEQVLAMEQWMVNENIWKI